MNFLLSLCDYSGQWAKPWREAGYTTILVDPKHPPGVSVRADAMILFGGTVDDFRDSRLITKVKGMRQDIVVLAAPPCTDFSRSGAHTWEAKDLDGRTGESISIVMDCLRVVDDVKPRIWALENPIGRMQRLVPAVGKAVCTVEPYQFADREDKSAYSEDTAIGKFLRTQWNGEPEYWEAYRKKTKLWGSFEKPVPNHSIEPIQYCEQGSWLMLLGGKSERTKALRSMTPTGFARAFYERNRLDYESL